MKGDIVIARAFGQKPLVRQVWDWTTDVVYICTEERFNKLIRGFTDLLPVGFPRNDVFVYDESVLPELENNPRLWDKLKNWHGDMIASTN